MKANGTRHGWRLLLEPAAPAAVNMARDEAILRSARRGGPTTLRFYSWRPWAFSLGYFQNYADLAEYARDGVEVVRRLTGGGAIFHADEITYSMAGRCGRGAFPERAADIFRKVHEAIAAGLARLGVDARLSDAPSGRSATICFQRPQKFDIVVSGRKLLGSAQRRSRGCFLQHGSLVLSENPFAPEAMSLAESLGTEPDREAATDALVTAFERAFDVRCRRGILSDEEEAEAAVLAGEKYGADSWNHRR